MVLKQEEKQKIQQKHDSLLSALLAEPLRLEELYNLDFKPEGSYDKRTWIMIRLTELERDGVIARYPDGKYGPARI